MDMNSLLNNPMAQQLMARLQNDPELMLMISRPGVMERFQQIQSDPANAQSVLQNDPEMASLMQRMMGGMDQSGGFGAPAPHDPWASAPTTQSSGWGSQPNQSVSQSTTNRSGGTPGVTHIHSSSQFHQAIAEAGSKLVVCDFTATWCGPCRNIAPVFNELANTYQSKAVFLHIDSDKNRELCQSEGVTGFPTFHIYFDGAKVDSFSGANERKLRSIVAEYADREPVVVCPYKHFPLKDAEQVKFTEMKWDVVDAKLNEFNQSPKLSEAQRLNPVDRADVDVIISRLTNKQTYHSATFNETQFKLMERLLEWPLECLPPVLNLWRVFITHPNVGQAYAQKIAQRSGNDLIDRLASIMSKADKPVIALLVVRIWCNCFVRRALAKAMGARSEEVLDSVFIALKKMIDENLRTSACALFINYTLLFNEDSTFYEGGKVQLLSGMPDQLGMTGLSATVAYRLCVVLGSLLYKDATLIEMANALELADVVDTIRSTFPQDASVTAVTDELKQLMSAQ